MRPPQGFEWLVILFVILLLFGAKRMPDMARGLGRSLRILKAETRGLTQEQEQEAAQERSGEPGSVAGPAPEGEQAPRRGPTSS